MFFDEAGGNDLDIQFDPQQFESVTPYSADLNDEYQQAQDQLRQLRQQEEQIRRQAEELEELTQKEDQFKEGRVEITEQLHKYLAMLDREATEAQRLAEDCGSAHEKLEAHLNSIQSLRPESWSRADRKAEIARALGYIESAEDELDSVMPLIESFEKKGFFKMRTSLLPTASPGTPFQGGFLYWLKSGFAFSLPLVVFAIIGALLVVWL